MYLNDQSSGSEDHLLLLIQDKIPINRFRIDEIKEKVRKALEDGPLSIKTDTEFYLRNTLIHLACKHNNVFILRLCVEYFSYRSPNFNPLKISYLCETPLHTAAANGSLSCIEFICSHFELAPETFSEIINRRDADDDTALHLAIRKQKDVVALYLLGQGANYLTANSRDTTPFTTALKMEAISVTMKFFELDKNIVINGNFKDAFFSQSNDILDVRNAIHRALIRLALKEDNKLLLTYVLRNYVPTKEELVSARGCIKKMLAYKPARTAKGLESGKVYWKNVLLKSVILLN